MKDIMNILLSCDNRIAKYIPALLASLYENHRQICVHSFLMHSTVSPKTLEIIKRFAEENGQELVEIRVKENDYEFFKQVDTKRLGSFPVEAYYHCLAAQYLPRDVERCMYLDVDTVCDSDLYGWYCTDFEDRFYVSSERYKKYYYECFNSGIFLINIKKLRIEGINRDFFQRKCLELAAEKQKDLMGDQEFLGFAFKDYPDNGFLSRPEEGLNLRIIWSRDIAVGLKEIPKIKLVHYNTNFKAWRYCFDESFLNSYIGRKINGTQYDFSFLSENVLYIYNLFWKYAEKAPFYEEIYHDALTAAAEIKRDIPFELNSKKFELFMKALEIKENNPDTGFVIPRAAYNEYSILHTETENYSEYKTQCYIKEQWIVFPLSRPLKRGDRLSIKIKCEYKTSRKIFLFLSNCSLKTRHLPAISECDYSSEITVDAEGYLFLCLSSNSFPDKGNLIRFFEIRSEIIPNIYGCEGSEIS